MKVLRCKDAGVNCDFVVKGQTEEEIFKNAAEHAKKSHGMQSIPEDLKVKMRALIKDE